MYKVNVHNTRKMIITMRVSLCSWHQVYCKIFAVTLFFESPQTLLALEYGFLQVPVMPLTVADITRTFRFWVKSGERHVE